MLLEAGWRILWFLLCGCLTAVSGGHICHPCFLPSGFASHEEMAWMASVICPGGKLGSVYLFFFLTFLWEWVSLWRPGWPQNWDVLPPLPRTCWLALQTCSTLLVLGLLVSKPDIDSYLGNFPSLPSLVWNNILLCSLDWSQSLDRPSSISQVAGLHCHIRVTFHVFSTPPPWGVFCR